MTSMTHRGLSRSTFFSSRAKIPPYVCVRPDTFDCYTDEHQLTVTEGYALHRLLLAVDRHTYTLEQVSVASLAEYVGLTRELSKGHAWRRMKQALDRLTDIGAITFEDGTITVLVYDELVRFGGRASASAAPAVEVVESRSSTTSTGATVSISEAPGTVSGRASARDTRAYTRDDRASAREATGETSPTNGLDTNPPTPQDDEVSIALAALHKRAGRQGRRFATTARLRDAVQACIANGWKPNELADSLTLHELDTAQNVAAVLTSRAELLGTPEQAPRLPDWSAEPASTDDEHRLARAGLASARAELAARTNAP